MSNRVLVAALGAALALAMLAPAAGMTSPAHAQQDLQAVAMADAEGVVIPNLDDVRGNVTLPTKGDGGSDLAWSSSDPAVIDIDGVVSRPAAGDDPIEVSLEVTATYEGATATATYAAAVTPLPDDEDLAGYVFPHFVGESTSDGEAIYVAISNGDDPTSWITLNGGEPVLTSNLGTQGLRDPFLIRSPDGDRFFLLATDLQIFGGGNFADAQQTGSRSLMVWETDDLVTWSEQREIILAPDDAGNLWAPEAHWDAGPSPVARGRPSSRPTPTAPGTSSRTSRPTTVVRATCCSRRTTSPRPTGSRFPTPTCPRAHATAP